MSGLIKEFKDVQLKQPKVIQHKHPLIAVDLQLMHQDYVEDDDEVDDKDLIANQNFKCTCDICGLGIDWYHRYYYKCSKASCDFSLHNFCANLSATLQFPAHDHTLLLDKGSDSWTCHACLTKHQHGICYQCSTCDYQVDLACVTFVDQSTIHHPGHPHPLILVTVDPTLSKCSACGKKHVGVFYHCITCFNFSMHVDCLTLQFKLSLQNLHTHMLTLSYSLSGIPNDSKCRICRMNISNKLWLYKCSKCRYYVHLDCAASLGEPFMSILSHGIGKTDTNFEAADYPDLLNYPLPDESYNIIPQQISRRGKDYRQFDPFKFNRELYMRSIHQHPLLLVNTDTDTSILGVPLHNPIKRIKLICNGCLRPITATPFYMCKQAHNSCCNFYLHEWCTRLPIELENHPGHPLHTLTLFHYLPTELVYEGFECNFCGLRCNGFGYVCYTCGYRVDVNCGFIPKAITHEAHPNHLCSLADPSSIHSTSTTLIACDACDIIIDISTEVCFRCSSCDFYLHNRCALNLPKTIKNKCDKHPLNLSYIPIENHKSQYFCEVCEEDLNPEKWFYHCKDCGQSIHTACAPLILKSEQDVNSLHVEGVYMFHNIKSGSSFQFRLLHPKVLLFLVGVKSDGQCLICQHESQSSLIFKCLECKIVFHVTCVMDKWPSLFRELPFYKHHRTPKKRLKHKTDHVALTFYPSGVKRPITWHGIAIDGVLNMS